VTNVAPRHEEEREMEVKLHTLLTSAQDGVVSFTFQPIYTRRKSPVPAGWEAGSQSRSGRGGEEKNPFTAPSGNRTPAVQPGA
jgi:hypothetical protein